MLAILWIISTISSFFTVVLNEEDYIEDSRKCFCIAISSEIIYSIIALHHFKNNVFNPNFVIIFGFLSLLFGNYAILSGNGINWLNHIICAFLASTVICFILSNVHFTDYYVYCNKNHDYSKRVPIITTIDGTKDGESIYGKGYSIGLIVKNNPNIQIYEYYYQREDGKIVRDTFYANRVKFTYINPNESPYVDIYYSVDCVGYRNISKTHTFSSISRTCHFYIYENSIADLPSTS